MNNDEIKAAIRAKLLGDATLTWHLGGEHVYQAAQRNLVAEDLETWITLGCVTQSVDPETGRASQLWQLDVWSRVDGARADAVAARAAAVLAWIQTSGGGTLPDLTTRRLAEPIYEEPAPPEIVEDGSLHHRIRQFRVATYPA